jgi:hypothetical protein
LRPCPRGAAALSLDALVAGVLILYPRYLDPVSGLPCPPEVLVIAWRARGDQPPALDRPLAPHAGTSPGNAARGSLIMRLLQVTHREMLG